MPNEKADALVFLRHTGDLAYKKIFPSLQAMIQHGVLDMPVIGVARAGWKRRQLRAGPRASLKEHGGVRRSGLRQTFRRMKYVDGDYNEPATYLRAEESNWLGAKRPLHYLAIPPSLFETVAEGLATASCTDHARVVSKSRSAATWRRRRN